MSETGKLAEAFLEQCPACHWVVKAEREVAPARKHAAGRTGHGRTIGASAGRGEKHGLRRAVAAQDPQAESVYRHLSFERVWGDSMTLFAKTPVELAGRQLGDALKPEAVQMWSGRFERAFEGETLTLRERRGKSI